MNLVTLEGVSKQYAERVLFEDANLRINRGDRIGLIGVNGSGKSALLRIVAGAERPDSGDVTVWGDTRIQMLPQEPRLDDCASVLDQLFRGDLPPMRLLRDYRQLAAGLQDDPDDAELQQQLLALSARMDSEDGWTIESRAKAILTRLDITDFEAVASTLSGGQYKRVALARALIDPADLLILDEPTNHVDTEAVAWLEDYLLTVPSALIMVTHDRYFLDRVVNRIVELDRRELVSYPGNYRRYLELRTARHERMAGAEVKRRKLLMRELEWLRRAPKARATKQKARRQRVQELRRLDHDSGEQRLAVELAGRRLGKRVLEATDLGKSYGDLTLFRGFSLELKPGERLGIVGPNGAGKTTLLDILAGRTEPDAGTVTWGDTVRLGYFDQVSEALEDSRRVIDYIEDEAPLIAIRDGARIDAARMLEWFLFPRPQQRAYIGSLSGGERRRLYLLRTLMHQPNVLFLDEPTNDLDVQTLTVLEAFLDHFKGCVVVVSHDRYFLDRTVDELIYLEDGQFGTRYPMPYSTFQRLRREEKERRRANEAAREAKPKSAAAKARGRELPLAVVKPRKLSWKERRELERLEARIAELEARAGELEADMMGCGSDYMRLEELSKEAAAADAELEISLARWLELSEIAEGHG